MRDTPSHRIGRAPGVRGFTLIELLVTLAIILMLAGLILAGLSGMGTRARRAKARSQVGQISVAWTQYLQDYKCFPTPGGDELVEMGEDAIEILRGVNPKGFTYLDFRTSTVAYNDPWHNPYQFLLDYALDNRVSDDVRGIEELRLSVAVWSKGPDGDSGTDDDVTNWK